MATKPTDGDYGAEIAKLREDITQLSDSIAQLVKRETDYAAAQLRTSVGRAAEAVAGRVNSVADDVARTGRQFASDAQHGVRNAASELESNIERNPLTAVLIAGGIGLVLCLLSRKG